MGWMEFSKYLRNIVNKKEVGSEFIMCTSTKFALNPHNIFQFS